MNYEAFQTYQKVFHLDEVKIIGRDIFIEEEWIHIVGMGRNMDGAYLYILEQQPAWDNGTVWKLEQTRRESMLESADRDTGRAIKINGIKIGEDFFEIQGGTCGNLAQMESVEAYFFFQQMMEKGWSLSETSPFHRLDWNCMGLNTLRLRDFSEALPELSGEIRQLTAGPTGRSYIIQAPVRLERGRTDQVSFSLEKGGEEIICYINQVRMFEPLIEGRKRFEDVQYREKALQHRTQEEFEEMRKTALESIEADCPEGMGYFTVEYECTKDDLSAQFFAVEELDSIPEPKEGCTSMIMMGGRPEQETGPHGFRNRCAVIQYAVPVGTDAMEAELFMVYEMIREKVIWEGHHDS